jgi:hypothetical protein
MYHKIIFRMTPEKRNGIHLLETAGTAVTSVLFPHQFLDHTLKA